MHVHGKEEDGVIGWVDVGGAACIPQQLQRSGLIYACNMYDINSHHLCHVTSCLVHIQHATTMSRTIKRMIYLRRGMLYV